MGIFKSSLLIAVIATAIGCGTGTGSNNAGNNQNKPATNTTPAPATPVSSANESSTGSLATPSDAYRTAYALREKKDTAGLKKVLSKDVIEFLSMIAEEEKKTLDDEIAQMFERPQAKTAETRNEQIKGERATLEYLDEKGGWKTMDFVKEGSDWKMSLPAKEDIKVESGSPDKKP